MKRVFVVDDSFFMREMLKDILSKADFEIAGEAAEGLEAIEKLSSIETDIVTLDIADAAAEEIEKKRYIGKEFTIEY